MASCEQDLNHCHTEELGHVAEEPERSAKKVVKNEEIEVSKIWRQNKVDKGDEIKEHAVKDKVDKRDEIIEHAVKNVVEVEGKSSLVAQRLNILKACYKEGLNSVNEAEEQWVAVEFAVDSGATDTVMNEEALECVETKPGPAFQKGVEYEVANGIKIPNEGEKEFTGISNEGVTRTMKAQICAVTKSLLSVKRIVGSGHRVVFDDESYIEDKATGERMWLEEKEGMYVVQVWIKNDGF